MTVTIINNNDAPFHVPTKAFLGFQVIFSGFPAELCGWIKLLQEKRNEMIKFV